ncbi:hypothetical protein PIROE2DRAFT_9545 [Piromyces sp. E2]|nr:hypothetical protein PIROE2DRAFT_9545 [Piromyces sp. E2]|eukprot:OUM63814.1 hypothetical protein PIROE2DRAFT_9545 [Piromyces sp. E2]
MTILETYPIHRCIYRNDVITLKELLLDNKIKERINEDDNHGNTPLHLALMLNRFSCISILLNNGGDVFTRNNFGWSPMDESALLIMDNNNNNDNGNNNYNNNNKGLGNPDIIRNLSYLRWKGIMEKITGPGGLLDEWKIPDMFFLYDQQYKSYNSVRSKLSLTRLYKILLDLSEFTIKEKKGGLLKKNTKTFQLENGKSYKCVQYRGKKAKLLIRKRNDEATIGESESIINTKYIKGDSSTSVFAKFNKNEKNGKSSSSSDSIQRKDSEISNSDDESDSDSSDSDNDSNDSDNEESESTTKKLPRQDSKSAEISEIMNSITGKKDDDSHLNNNTVTYTVNKDGETKTYEKETDLEDTLDWEQAYCDKYYQTNNDMVSNLLTSKDDEKAKHLNHMDIVKLNLKKITEEEYFDPKSTDPIHMGRIMNVIEERKPYKYKVKMWMAKESSKFPIVPYDVKPIFELFMMLTLDQIKSKERANSLDKITYNFITQELIERAQEKKSFPVKISIPLYQSVAFQLTFLNCSKDVNIIPDEIFEIPKDYKNTDVFFKIINK